MQFTDKMNIEQYLINELETAWPSRSLDGRIFKTLEERPGDNWVLFADEDVWHHECREERMAYIGPPYYTSSVDAAIKLIPKEIDFELGTARLINFAWARIILKDIVFVGKGKTLSTAVCNAALKMKKHNSIS